LSIIGFYRKKLKQINRHNQHSPLSKNYLHQKKILESLRSPTNNMERALNQYLCQNYYIPFPMKILQNIISLFLLPFVLFATNRNVESQNKFGENAVFLREGVSKNIIPNSLINEYESIFECTFNEPICIGKKERKFIFKNILKYWYRPLFCMKIILKIGQYSTIIRKYNPKALIVHCEYSYTSSALTEFCHTYGVEHINVMHGEKLYNIRDSFVKFDRYYVWDQHYVELLSDLKAFKEQFRIELPKAIYLLTMEQEDFQYEITYYLGAESKEQLIKIREILLSTSYFPGKICIRYHPRYSDQNQVKQIFKEFKLETPSEVPLNVSFMKTRYVVSLYSTVLFQAYKSGKGYIIDDASDLKNYQKLKDLKFIMVTKPHLRLSEIVN
jgi:hypothetical protein